MSFFKQAKREGESLKKLQFFTFYFKNARHIFILQARYVFFFKRKRIEIY